MESASVSKPRRPALPTIYLYSAVSSSLPIFFADVMITRLAGKLTPAASVVVQKMTLSNPSLKRVSVISRSCRLRPAWWYPAPCRSILATFGEIICWFYFVSCPPDCKVAATVYSITAILNKFCSSVFFSSDIRVPYFAKTVANYSQLSLVGQKTRHCPSNG